MEANCDNCRFWGWLTAIDGEMQLGSCRKAAPVLCQPMLMIDDETEDVWRATQFPVTEKGQWCGEHQEMPLPPGEEKPA
jgi:hypothetical protein